MTDQFSFFDTLPVKDDTERPESVTKFAIPVTEQTKPETPAEWALRKWAEYAIPQWRKILAEAVEQGDEDRTGYAKKLLKKLEE